MTLREYIIFWQETYDSHQSRPTTYAAHNYVFKNHILPGLGDIPLSELTSEMVGEFLEERRRFGNHRPGSSGLGEETMRHIHRLLQQCLDQAIRDGLLTENPAKAFRYRKSTTVKANIMTPLEMEDYCNASAPAYYDSIWFVTRTRHSRSNLLNRIFITRGRRTVYSSSAWLTKETVHPLPSHYNKNKHSFRGFISASGAMLILYQSNENFSVPYVSVIGLYDNTGGMN